MNGSKHAANTETENTVRNIHLKYCEASVWFVPIEYNHDHDYSSKNIHSIFLFVCFFIISMTIAQIQMC